MKDLNYYLNLPYEIIVKKISDEDGGGYFARYKDFPYIMGDGENEVEALKDVKNAFKGAIELSLEKGDYIKEPSSEEAKVRINITLPKGLIEAIDKVSNNRSKFLADVAMKSLKYSINENITYDETDMKTVHYKAHPTKARLTDSKKI